MKSLLYSLGLFVAFQQGLSQTTVSSSFPVSLDGGLTSVPITNLIKLPNVLAVTTCSNNCSSMISTITNCANNNDTAPCYCNQSLQTAMVDCEQCMFNALVAENVKAPSAIVGSNPALAGFASTCKKS